MPFHRIILRILLPVAVIAAFGAGSLSQPLRQKPFHQHQIEDKTTADDSRTAGAYFRLGLGNLNDPSNSDRAVSHLEKAVELDDANAEYHFMLAEAYRANFEYAGLVRMPFLALKVKAQLETAVRLDPESATYHEALMNYYVYAPLVLGGSYQKAHDQAKEISAIDPYLGMLAHAGVYAEEGESRKAGDLYRKAISSRPGAWQGYQQFGKYYLGNHETDAAIALFKLTIDAAPEQADGHALLGESYQQKGLHAEAIKAFQKALDRDPSRTPLVFRIAQLQEMSGNTATAREQYQRYLTMVPSGKSADDARAKIRELGR